MGKWAEVERTDFAVFIFPGSWQFTGSDDRAASSGSRGGGAGQRGGDVAGVL